MRNIVYNETKALLDQGTYFGRGVFETILIKDEPILLKEHIKRLNSSIGVLKLGEEVNIENVREFIKKNNIVNIALKICVTEKNIIFNTRPIKYKEEHYIRGFKARFSNVLRNSTSKLTYIKSLNYLENIMEYEEIQKDGYDEAIFINEKGEVAEGCTTNIFIVKNNIMYTPKINCGLLPGILRSWVIDNFPVSEKIITIEELLLADEVFFTNSLVGIIKASEIQGRHFDFKVTEKIRSKYNSFIQAGGYGNE